MTMIHPSPTIRIQPRFDAGPLFGEPAGLVFDGVERWLWWGPDLDGEDCVAIRGGRLLTFESAAAVQATFPVLTLKAVAPASPTPGAAGPVCGPVGCGPASASCGCDSAAADSDSEDGGAAEDDDPVAADLGPAQDWVRGKRLAVPTESALNLWNLGIDVARSTGQAFVQRGGLRDRCHDKLMANQAPWMFGLEEYQPVWSARELAVLRETLGRAVHVLRAALP
ncbi:hypothetical protein [Actinoplanes regularis]|uniref:hypothetical protein n=1 Tax=Actinoplanes regularis TaxID=52697 RepID=UPI00249FA330|nr:hypothetical protein [Actinoplanes regularis]GLW30191.1 hypothetical protein Areg01_31310 [Actinoplanes regularis]